MSDRGKDIVKKFASRDADKLKKAVDEAQAATGLSSVQKQELASGLISLFYREHENDRAVEKVIDEAERVTAGLGADVVGMLVNRLLEADMESAPHFAKTIGLIGAPAIDAVLKALDENKNDQYACVNLLLSAGCFQGAKALRLAPVIFDLAGSDNPQVKASALGSIGKLADGVDPSLTPDETKTEMFDVSFSALSSPSAIVRLHAVRAIGRLLHHSYLSSQQVDKAHKAYRAILGMDDFEWDNAYIVRSEAEHYLHFCRSGAQKSTPGQRSYNQDFKILSKRELCPNTYHFRINAPFIARKIQAGQFVMIRPNANSERIPLSVCGWSRDEGYLELIIMACGRTSTEAVSKGVGDSFQDMVGPLGQRSHVAKYDGACVVLGGGYGTGAIIPTARDLRELGNRVIGIVGARTKDLLIMVDELREVCDEVFTTTNDGSDGIEGFVTHALAKIMEKEKVSTTLAVGPVPMMIAVTRMTEEKGVECWVSLNAIMVDGTGMCGACRVSVGGETKFACFHGPDFDGHKVDFDELMKRQKMFVDKEKIAMEAMGK